MQWLTAIVLRIAELGAWGPILFVALYAVVAIPPGAPAFLLTVAAGALFGVWWGTTLVFIGASLGASAAYAVSVRVSRTRMMGWMDRDPRVSAVRGAVAGEGAWVQFLLRLSPLVPFILTLSGDSHWVTVQKHLQEEQTKKSHSKTKTGSLCAREVQCLDIR